MGKGLLLIDDNTDHVAVIRNISHHLKINEQIHVTPFHLNPQHKDYWDDNKDPNIEKVIDGIKQTLATYKASLIVVDQYYSAASFNGLLLVERIRAISKFKNCPIFLISGKRDKIVREIFNDKVKQDAQKVDDLSKIINLKITRFLDKSFRDEAIETLKIRDLTEILPEKLREFEVQGLTIPSLSHRFLSLTCGELADLAESNTKDASIVLQEILDLALSHYISINEELQ